MEQKLGVDSAVMDLGELRAVVQQLYVAEGENDIRLGRRLGVNNVTARRWRLETFRPGVENVLRIAREAGLNPYDALSAIDRGDLADWLRETARTSPVTGGTYTPPQLSTEELFIVNVFRRLREQAPGEADALVAFFETRVKALDQTQHDVAHAARRPRRRRS